MANQKTLAFPLLVVINFILICGCINFTMIAVTVLYTFWFYKIATIWKHEGKLEFLNDIKE